MKLPWTKSTPIARRVSKSAWVSTCSAITRNLEWLTVNAESLGQVGKAQEGCRVILCAPGHNAVRELLRG